ncbi:uroporphyrinogen decarboxylase family protein [[Eubacterium] cellulosolvens]
MVPIMEMDINPPIIEQLLKGSFRASVSLQTPISAQREEEAKGLDMIIAFYRKVGFDAIPCNLSAPDGWKSPTRDDGSIEDEWGRVLNFDDAAKTWVPVGTTFISKDQLEDFHFPDPEASGRTFSLEHVQKSIKGDMAVAAFIRDPFAHAWEMFTPVNFVRWLYSDPSFIRGVIGRITDFNMKMIQRAAEVGADFIISGGDYAEKRGPMVPKKSFQDIVLPSLKRQVEEAHRRGLPFIKHTDGNVNPLLDDLSAIVDGVHSLDPSAGVNIADVKERYGDRLILFGNVSVDLLCLGNSDDVTRETRKCIEAAAPGGGYILSSSNSWYADAKLDNCLTMVKAGRKYGGYSKDSII